MTRRAPVAMAVLVWLAASVGVAGVRDHTRPDAATTAVSGAQASLLNLSLTDVDVRPIQTWVRTSVMASPDRTAVVATLLGADAGLVRPGQRVRCFSIASRTQMHQGVVTAVIRQNGVTRVSARLADALPADGSRYLMEVVADRGAFLSVPNAAIIEEQDRRVVYVQRPGGRYEPVEVETGIQGELYTQVISGLVVGEQIVSIGSFFIDAEHKLHAPAGGGSMPGMNHGAMPGMDHGAMPGMGAGAPTR